MQADPVIQGGDAEGVPGDVHRQRELEPQLLSNIRQGGVEDLVDGIDPHFQFVARILVISENPVLGKQVEDEPLIPSFLQPSFQDVDGLLGQLRWDLALDLGLDLYLVDDLVLEIHVRPLQGCDVGNPKSAGVIREHEDVHDLLRAHLRVGFGLVLPEPL